MNTALLVLPLLLAIAFSFYFSGMETGIYVLNRVRLRLRAERGRKRALRVFEMLRRPQLLISTILIGNHLANFLATSFSQVLVLALFQVSDPELLNTILLSPLLFLSGEIIPKNFFRTRGNRLVVRHSLPLWIALRTLLPVTLLLRALGRLTRALPRSVPAPDAMLERDRLQSLVREVAEEGTLTGDQERMVRNVLRLSTVPVREAMVPIGEADALTEGFDVESLLAASAVRAHTRLPVRRADGSGYLGVVSVLDLVYRPELSAAELVREAPRVKEGHSVERALRRLRRDRQVMGLVCDEDGRVTGLITVKDLVEEVSGELPVF